MRVLMIGAGNPPPPFIQRQADSLKQANIAVSFLPPIHRTRFQSFLARLGFHSGLTSEHLRLLKNSDILHYQWPSDWLTMHKLAFRFRKKVVLSLRGSQINIWPHLPGREKFAADLLFYMPLCGAFHAVSQAMRAEALNFGVKPERVRVIYTAVDTDYFLPSFQKSDTSAVQVIMVGGIIWLKGYEYALLAMAELVKKNQNVNLTIVGDGDEKDRLLAAIKDLNLQNHVLLAGKLDRQGVRAVLQKSDIFLHASLSEGIANSAIEAMSCGLPVVSTSCGGMSEAITDGVEGFLVHTRDPDAIAQAVSMLIADVNLRHQMGDAGRKRVLAQFSPYQQSLAFKRFYEDILSE